MKKLLLILSLCGYCLLAAAQNTQQTITVKGTVIDSATNAGLGYVTVAIQNAATKVPVRSMLARDNGTFELTAPSGPNYQLTLVVVGYTNKLIALKGGEPVIDLGRVLLSPSSKQLKEVSVNVVRPLMKQEVDRISYDVQADPETPVLNALDIMRKVPLLSVDGSDNILLKGNSSYKIFINGKESALVAKNPSDILKSMPATNIEKIEVITTPPAKYDAEGLTGIINIITKQKLPGGYNIGVNGRLNSVFGPGINLNGTYKKDKFGISVLTGISHNAEPMLNSGSTQNFFAQKTSLIQNGTTSFSGNNCYTDLEMSYEIDSLNLVTTAIDIFYNSSFNTNNQVSNTINALGATSQFYSLGSTNSNPYTGFDANINYQLGFAHQKGRLLTFSYKFSSSPDHQSTSNVFSQRYNYSQALVPDYNQYNNDGSKVNTFQLDYIHPRKNLTVEAGAKAIFRDNYSNFNVDDRDSVTNKYITNTARTNDFTYQQNTYGLYNSYQLSFEEWAIKAGLRLEHTSVNADFTSTASTVKENYNNLIPSISVQRKFKFSSLNLGFTERIQRPSIYQLNPFVDASNPSYVSFGNPTLKPETNHTFELTYSNFVKNSINIVLSYAFSNNSIQNISGLQVTNVGGKNDTITTFTYQNLGKHSTLGLNINSTINFTKNFTFNINGQVSQIWLQGAYNGQLYKNNGIFSNLFANATYNFGNGYRVACAGGLFSGNVTLQGKSSSGTYLSPVVSKTFLNKAATIGLAVNNPFAKYQTFTNTTTTPDYYRVVYNQGNVRSFAIRFNYRFGKLTSDIKKNERAINGDDTGSKN